MAPLKIYTRGKRRGASREAGKIVRFTAERLGAVVASLPVWHESLEEMLLLRLRSELALNTVKWLTWPEGIGRIGAAYDYPRNWSFTKTSAPIEIVPDLAGVRNTIFVLDRARSISPLVNRKMHQGSGIWRIGAGSTPLP